jgi:hypothetical protein
MRICWSLDFNIDTMCSGVIQHDGRTVRVIDEFSLPDTDTDSACDAFLVRAAERGWDLKDITIYGDATGWARDSTNGKSDWAIVLRRLHNLSPRLKVPRSNPAVKDTINGVRAMLRSADGPARLSIDPRCNRLIQDLRNAVWPGDIEDQHALSWLRYFIDWEYSIGMPAAASAGAVGFSKMQREP